MKAPDEGVRAMRNEMGKSSTEIAKKKKCFIIMPIADIDGYESGHFSRVYSHVIKPACERSGFIPIRADEVASSNYIVIDILSKIIESDIVICDLSGKNPNVLYELGIRQAFNLPTVLIKDKKTDNIFDIQGLRHTEYNHELRVDAVEKQVAEISTAIKETERAKGKDVNSLIQLLGMRPATLPSQVELSGETSVLLSAIKDLSNRISSLESTNKMRGTGGFKLNIQAGENIITKNEDGKFNINSEKISIGETLYIRGEEIGELVEVYAKEIRLKSKDGEIISISTDESRYRDVSALPF